MSYNRGAVSTRLRVLSLRLSFGVDLNGGAQGALRAYVSRLISTISMLILVENPQVYVCTEGPDPTGADFWSE